MIKHSRHTELINFLYQAKQPMIIAVTFNKHKDDISIEFAEFLNLISMGNHIYQMVDSNEFKEMESVTALIYIGVLVHEVTFSY
jgi:hypothetical protein